MNIELTKKQRENLIIFLQRVQLTGAEVPAFVEIAEAINKPMLEKINPKEDQNKNSQDKEQEQE